jgi:glycosyltransferase involved in cell wall biosynthesis
VISIIIPVLNEGALVRTALETLLRQTGDYEVILADGGSQDGTCEVVRQFPVRLLEQPLGAPPGLGDQINRGARRAQGDILVFLHLDVELPPGAIALIESALSDPQFIGGGFMPVYSGPVQGWERRNLDIIERLWQRRTSKYGFFAGDNAPFIRSDMFRLSGGYPPACFASDWDFADKLRRLGKVAVIREPVRVHSRRLVQNGVWKTTLVTVSVRLLYGLRADREFMRKWYRTWLPRER